ncbi:MAG: hypothetical protein PHV30_12160, partial [Candidatus Margulisbacteria bacterium]|nr:hypothetical protein [Candidatus Margulisiibacteriota bacterium]
LYSNIKINICFNRTFRFLFTLKFLIEHLEVMYHLGSPFRAWVSVHQPSDNDNEGSPIADEGRNEPSFTFMCLRIVFMKV